MFVKPIDWRNEFDQLDPYIKESGGVARIRFAGKRCAPGNFLDALKSVFEKPKHDEQRRSLRIDQEIYTVRYLSGIRDEIVSKLNVDLPTAPAPPGTAVLNVQCGLEAKKDVNAQATNIRQDNFFGDNPELMSKSRNDWLKRFNEMVRDFLDKGRFMIVVNHGTPKDQDEFWRFMWKNGLERFVNSGLLLIHMLDISISEATHDMAPTPDLEFDLPTALGPVARGHATEDIADILHEELPSMARELARARADTVVRTHFNDIHRLHVQTGALLIQLAREAKA